MPSANAQLTANAGNNHTICPGDSVQIGGMPAATGGLSPYTYHWSPSAFLSSTTIANPKASPSSTYVYTLTVTDDTGAVASAIVTVGLKYINNVNAGNNISICKGSDAVIGNVQNVSGQGITYIWSPTISMNDSTLPRPTVAPSVTTTYELKDTMASCKSETSFITVTVINVIVNAGIDTAIDEGQNITLHATGADHYIWTQDSSLNYANTPNPDVQPIVTTTYYVTGFSPTWQCSSRDSVIVTVRKGGMLFFYNTFTPNGDGNNDTWYIGNIYKYPNNNLQVFNRYGQLVFRVDGYANTWDGKAFGNDLPSATYFYILDPGDGTASYHGTVTIIR